MSAIDWIKDFFLVLTPLFVAIDSVGVLPMFLALTKDIEEGEKQKLVRDAVATAFVVGVIFLFGGKAIFRFLGITQDDFRIGGGCLLFLIAISDLLFSKQQERRIPDKELAIVPIGIPLILGPGALTTILILADRHGYFLTLISIVVNMLIAWLTFSRSRLIFRTLGKGGTHALGKIASLFLLAIAIMMIRVGITNLIKL